MPTSIPQALTIICNNILKLKPKTMLDIGIGHGKWGFLTREYTDVWKSIMNPNEFQTIIHGIEVYEDYISDIQKNIYDKIYIGEANNIIYDTSITVYDLIIMADVIEHMPKEIGMELLKKIQNKCKIAFITTPKYVKITGKSMNYNPYETHLCEWSTEELNQFGSTEDIGNNVLLLTLKGI